MEKDIILSSLINWSLGSPFVAIKFSFLWVLRRWLLCVHSLKKLSLCWTNSLSCCHKKCLITNKPNNSACGLQLCIVSYETSESGNRIYPDEWDDPLQIITQPGIPSRTIKHGVGSWSLSQWDILCLYNSNKSFGSF